MGAAVARCRGGPLAHSSAAGHVSVMQRALRRVLAAVALASVPAAAGAATGIALDYEVRYGPLAVLEVHSTTRLDGGRYETTSEMRTVGVIGLLFPWSAGSRTAGSGRGVDLAPLTHRSHGEFRGVDRTVAIDYAAGGNVAARVEPSADSDERDAVPADLQQATIDPLTAGLAAVASGCSGRLRVFDGRRRYDMVLADQGEVEVPSRAAIYQGVARRCRVTIAPLAGFWRRSTREDERATHIDAWIAAPRPDLMPVPVYLELSAPRGTLGIHLSAARVLDADERTENTEPRINNDEHR